MKDPFPVTLSPLDRQQIADGLWSLRLQLHTKRQAVRADDPYANQLTNELSNIAMLIRRIAEN